MKKIKVSKLWFFLLLFLFLDIPQELVASEPQREHSEATIHLSGWGDSQEGQQETTVKDENKEVSEEHKYPQTGEDIDWKSPILGLILTFLTMLIYLIIDKRRRKNEK